MTAVDRRDYLLAELRCAALRARLWQADIEAVGLALKGGARDAKTGAILKRMGTLAGTSDFLLWHQGNSFALELKAPGGRPSEAQLDFMARFADAGGHTCIAEGLNQALAALESWQLLRGRVS
jgi:hypothetical protein